MVVEHFLFARVVRLEMKCNTRLLRKFLNEQHGENPQAPVIFSHPG